MTIASSPSRIAPTEQIEQPAPTAPPVPAEQPAEQPAWNRQRPSGMPSRRYREVFDRVDVPLVERTWPTARFTAAPLWVPVDLRDGNQALAEPMSPERKRRFFELMVRMGYTEIEVGYPSASQTDYDFVRLIADTDIAPEHVTIVVFTPARRDLIERTVQSIQGIRNPVVIHMYAATAPSWRDLVLGKSRDELTALVVAGGEDVLRGAGGMPNVRFEFSPEVFNLTEPDYVLGLCDRMTSLWDASPERPVILNLPATVEIATPNVYADQIEYMNTHLARRDGVILSVHPHNDRGTGIACAELAVLAGAQRVEGCIFGNGERTGNVDIATLALNLHAQGVDPMIDFSDIDGIRRVVEECTRMPIHERHPYVGDLVYTAFSGTHQDAIKKGFAAHRSASAAAGVSEREHRWEVPYLPIDPADVGRSYDAVIRVNSQSGKGGMAYLLETASGLELPRRLQIDFSKRVQAVTDGSGEEVTAEQLLAIFREAYVDGGMGVDVGADAAGEADVAAGSDGDDGTDVAGRASIVGGADGSASERAVRLIGWSASKDVAGAESTQLAIRVDGVTTEHASVGIGPVDALVSALASVGRPIEVLGLTQQSLGEGAASQAATYLEYRAGGRDAWAVGIDDSVLAATLAAVIRAASSVA
ncbi:2-isopropylmalate synthase [Plantibacter sp. YIM 135347]|uniref:2-isopropylmalate synthase n=1 Tax=Plantibacter sp. YIM 135347 TaxID=3423919 RepID=UPI003D356BC8